MPSSEASAANRCRACNLVCRVLGESFSTMVGFHAYGTQVQPGYSLLCITVPYLGWIGFV